MHVACPMFYTLLTAMNVHDSTYMYMYLYVHVHICYTMYVVCFIPKVSFLYVYALGLLNRFKGQCAITGGNAGGEPNMQPCYSCSQTLLMCVMGLEMT